MNYRHRDGHSQGWQVARLEWADWIVSATRQRLRVPDGQRASVLVII